MDSGYYGYDPVPPGWGYAPPPPAPEPAPKRRHLARWIAVAVVAALVLSSVEAIAVGTAWSWLRAHRAAPVATSTTTGGSAGTGLTTVPQASGATAGGIDSQAVAGKVEPAVVVIDTVVAGLNGSGEAAGTGFIVTSSGEVVTNNHVVKGATSIKATTGSGRTYTASVVGVSTTKDVALLQLQGASDLPTVTLADSATVTVGEPVVAIGNALGQGSLTATDGNVVALDQSITAADPGAPAEQLTGLIEMNAPIQPGDSGGPLVNSAGQVIGMDTAGQTTGRRRQASSVAGFAVPSATIVAVVEQVVAGRTGDGVVIGTPGYLGVAVNTVGVGDAGGFGFGVSGGAEVVGVASGSPAARAGIGTGAVITAIDGVPIASPDELGPAIQAHAPGSQIKVTWVDGSGTHTATVTLASGPAA